MARVDAFNKGKFAKDDEYYTLYEDIQAELNHYKNDFLNKTVLCNCDDPFESNFCKFFLKNFNYLKLKRLICTSYSGSPFIGTQLKINDSNNEPVSNSNGYVMDVNEVPMKNGRGVTDEDITTLLKSESRGVKKLNGNGDFRSEECIEYLKQADIVVTNCPFSLFREYIGLLVKFDKKFLIIGRETSITYKDTFQLIIENKAWYGYNHVKSFIRPDGSSKSFGNVVWFTNLDVSKRHEKMILYKSYNPDDYQTYYNYDGIDVSVISEIPKDYYGNMGVPLSFLDHWNPEQFEIIGMGQSVPKKIIHVTNEDTIDFINAITNEVVYSVPYSVPERKRGNQLRILENGRPGRVPFGRLVIRRRNNAD